MFLPVPTITEVYLCGLTLQHTTAGIMFSWCAQDDMYTRQHAHEIDQIINAIESSFCFDNTRKCVKLSLKYSMKVYALSRKSIATRRSKLHKNFKLSIANKHVLMDIKEEGIRFCKYFKS
jgi:hypothetical protein